jgi:predicted transcriptional regulator
MIGMKDKREIIKLRREEHCSESEISHHTGLSRNTFAVI